MERRSFLVWAVLLLAAGGLRGQSTMLINPPNPQPGDSVTITLPGVLACDVTLDAAVIPPGKGNATMVVKVLNACSVNQRYWVFMAGLTNLNVKVSVQDRFTGRTEVYTNTLGQAFQPVLDTTSFAVCP